MKRKLLAVWAGVWTVGVGWGVGGAWGQVAGGGGERPQPPPPTQAGPAESPNTAFQRSGGSLFRMDNAMPQGGNAPTASSSVFAVRPAEPRQIKKFDLVTVIIREESESKSESNSDLKKRTDFDLLLEVYPYLSLSDLALKGKAPPANQPRLKFGGSRNFKGEGTVERSDSVIARIQAQVIDVKPNGILVIQATKQIKSDEEELRLVVTGMVRAEDVTPDNSVLSTQVADLMVEKHTSGSARRAGQRGLIPRLVDKINPF